MSLKNTQTEKNIIAAFSGECQARTKYTFFAETARAEGNEKTALLFEKMAENEKHHAKLWLQTLQGSISTSTENLKSAINAEHYESTQMYKSFALTAREEGFEDIAVFFERICEVEHDHERMFKKELIRISEPGYKPQPTKPCNIHKPDEALPSEKQAQPADVPAPTEAIRAGKQKWRCPICGLVVESDEAPYLCELCGALGVWDMIK